MDSSSESPSSRRIDHPDTVDNCMPEPSGSLPMDPSHMIFHVVDSTEDPFALVVRAWNTWLVLDAASQRDRSCSTREQRSPLIHVDLCLCVTRILPPLIEDNPRGGRNEVCYDVGNACANHNPW